MVILLDILAATWATLAEMAPYLFLGFAVAGLLSVFVSKAWVERHLGGRGLWPSIKAAALGVPLPLCSCGVIPVAASLREHGASKGATTSFLISTPQTGVDSIFATYALLGPVFAIVRPVIALVSGVVGGGIVDATEPAAAPRTACGEPSRAVSLGVKSSCCGEDSCCSEPKEATSWRGKFGAALRYGLITLPNDIARPLILGIVLAGVITALATPGTLQAYLGGFGGMILMLVIGIPLYVCSTGSIPMALSFMYLGASPGAALVFLITGPATNAATIAVNWKVLGRRVTLIYLATVVISSLGAGLLLNAVAASSFGQLIPQAADCHVEGVGPIKQLFGAALVVMLVAAMVISRWPRRQPSPQSTLDPTAMTQILDVQGMTCSHCAAAVTRTLKEQPGVTSATVELASGRATINGDKIDAATIIRAIEKLGYTARPA